MYGVRCMRGGGGALSRPDLFDATGYCCAALRCSLSQQQLAHQTFAAPEHHTTTHVCLFTCNCLPLSVFS